MAMTYDAMRPIVQASITLSGSPQAVGAAAPQGCLLAYVAAFNSNAPNATTPVAPNGNAWVSISSAAASSSARVLVGPGQPVFLKLMPGEKVWALGADATPGGTLSVTFFS